LAYPVQFRSTFLQAPTVTGERSSTKVNVRRWYPSPIRSQEIRKSLRRSVSKYVSGNEGEKIFELSGDLIAKLNSGRRTANSSDLDEVKRSELDAINFAHKLVKRLHRSGERLSSALARCFVDVVELVSLHVFVCIFKFCFTNHPIVDGVQ
jgi:hypothetical protein